ncbi:lipase [Auriscalpium vulgare]|uniref:Lipase n=1 Tax=Auriscalpium vulgare TaxID=40419 RepID=A0ACB8R6S8_9AGAM|nr:lipase [Auriscalpium vulgare]
MAARAFTYASAITALVAGFVDGAAVSKRQSITTLSTDEIGAFKPFTFFASTAYCNPSETLTWSCGMNCDANPGFQPVASGGDGGSVQFWFVGFAPAQNTIIVSHQGTDPHNIMSLLTDGDLTRRSLDPTLFPGVSSSVEVHNGFAGSQASTAAAVLAAVKQAMSAHDTNTVTVVGHSLGAALALLDSVFLSLNLPSGTTVNTIGYGMPRVGNQEFVDYIDAHQNVTHVNNQKDPIPTVPGLFLGYHHSSGEVHIQASNAWDACPGQDSDSKSCIVGDVPNIFESTESNHIGPYDSVTMGC